MIVEFRMQLPSPCEVSWCYTPALLPRLGQALLSFLLGGLANGKPHSWFPPPHHATDPETNSRVFHLLFSVACDKPVQMPPVLTELPPASYERLPPRLRLVLAIWAALREKGRPQYPIMVTYVICGKSEGLRAG